jgi:hypothetical protein
MYKGSSQCSSEVRYAARKMHNSIEVREMSTKARNLEHQVPITSITVIAPTTTGSQCIKIALNSAIRSDS